MPLDTELPFALSPEAAIEWFRQKSLLLTFSAAQLLAEERATAFTVAGLMDLALLETVRDAVDRALATPHLLCTQNPATCQQICVSLAMA